MDDPPGGVDERPAIVDERRPDVDGGPLIVDASKTHMLRSDHPSHHYMLWFGG